MTDPAGKVWNYTFDALGRRTSLRPADLDQASRGRQPAWRTPGHRLRPGQPPGEDRRRPHQSRQRHQPRRLLTPRTH
ncbi:hypothetical protein ACFPC0_17235 [Streptomyces andamanensis]|uniref:RHS repeat protein n=1 Tax=Streptomyces andamanensis TaxID=1565035 RepID=A0ABV8TG82_9ACTN